MDVSFIPWDGVEVPELSGMIVKFPGDPTPVILRLTYGGWEDLDEYWYGNGVHIESVLAVDGKPVIIPAKFFGEAA